MLHPKINPWKFEDAPIFGNHLTVIFQGGFHSLNLYYGVVKVTTVRSYLLVTETRAWPGTEISKRGLAVHRDPNSGPTGAAQPKHRVLGQFFVQITGTLWTNCVGQKLNKNTHSPNPGFSMTKSVWFFGGAADNLTKNQSPPKKKNKKKSSRWNCWCFRNPANKPPLGWYF